MRGIVRAISSLGLRIEKGRRRLIHNDSIYVHIDYHCDHQVCLLLEEIFRIKAFLLEIIWTYDHGGRSEKPVSTQAGYDLLVCQRSRELDFEQGQNRAATMHAPPVAPEKAAEGNLPPDTWGMTIVPTSSKERTGCPTQKTRQVAEKNHRGFLVSGRFYYGYFLGISNERDCRGAPMLPLDSNGQ